MGRQRDERGARGKCPSFTQHTSERGRRLGAGINPAQPAGRLTPCLGFPESGPHKAFAAAGRGQALAAGQPTRKPISDIRRWTRLASRRNRATTHAGETSAPTLGSSRRGQQFSAFGTRVSENCDLLSSSMTKQNLCWWLKNCSAWLFVEKCRCWKKRVSLNKIT